MVSDFNTVIFDMDGTLVDSMGLWEDIDREFFKERNLPYPEDLTKNIAGLSMTETADYFLENFDLKESREDLIDIWNEMAMDEYATKVPLRDGAMEFLRFLKKNGYKTALATSNSRELVEACFKKHGLNEYIPVIVASGEVEHGKPAPDVFLKAASLLNSDPKDCIVFEDVIQGIIAGKSAGMKVCCVDDIYSKDDYEEKKKLADYYIKNYYDLDVVTA
jgi:HAD superfamily hydrolase (TIGR01509 family)